MEKSLHEILTSYPEATVGIALRDLDAGTSFDYNAGRVFHAASTMKVPVMIEVFRQAEAGRFGLDDSLVVTNRFNSIVDGSPYVLDTADDSDADVYRKIGRSATIRWLVERMITVSSNLATNILIDYVGADAVQSTIEALGITTMEVHRGVEDIKAYDLGLNNTATAGDLATLLQRLAQGAAVSPEADSTMVEILFHQEFNDIIPAGLPQDVRVAHKTGSITEIHHDAAIVYPPDRRPYVLVILTEGVANPDRSAKLGAEIAAAIHGGSSVTAE
jgi:beta-lactamase class A